MATSPLTASSEWQIPDDIGEIAAPLVEFLLEHHRGFEDSESELSRVIVGLASSDSLKNPDSPKSTRERGDSRVAESDAPGARPPEGKENGCCVIL